MKSILLVLFAGTTLLPLFSDVAIAESANETVVYSFPGTDNDGLYPTGKLIKSGEFLYGTTSSGRAGAGTVFAINPSTGSEKVVHNFLGAPSDGGAPYAGVIELNGILYGTTIWGGSGKGTFCDYMGCGTVFAINLATGTETILHSFCPGRSDCLRDGRAPASTLLAVNGKLYGTTENGGAYDMGTIFSIDLKTSAEKVDYSFGTAIGDGDSPSSGLIHVKGLLYGTTEGGGANCPPGCAGTVFSLNPDTGVESVVYSFSVNGTDGIYPLGNLVYEGGSLYGTTERGGDKLCHARGHMQPPGCGTVFSLNPETRVETIAHSFADDQKTDGKLPDVGLLDLDGTLYGVTPRGGESRIGAVFSLDPKSDTETLLYSFEGNGSDGENPQGKLTEFDGTLYGTTFAGGAHGAGTVFAIAP